MSSLFLTQEIIDQWLEADRIILHQMELSDRGRGFVLELEPAYAVISAEAGAEAGDLVGKVLDREAINRLGVELYRDTILYQGRAYKVVEGFIGRPRPQALNVRAGPRGWVVKGGRD